jgi:Leucine-rich repeat (LRR) protein
MCILCEGYSYLTNFTNVSCLTCSKAKKIPKKIQKEFTKLTVLDCSRKKITKLPKEFTQLTWLNCCYTKITEIPKEFTQLTYLNCSETQITTIPKELDKLERLHCSYTKITEIPKEFTQLTQLNCSETKITEIPKEITQLTGLYCYNCPNLVKVPEKFKEEYVSKYNFLRVPTKSRIIFNQYKKGYIESVRFDMEIKFNEVYYGKRSFRII